MAKRKPEPDDKEQSKRFVETARALEAEQNGKSFERAVKTIVPAKQETPPKKN